MVRPGPAGREDPRWEYKVLWRYGALLLVAVGLLAMGFGAAGVSSTAIGVTLLPIGFVCLVAGVVLPRIEGKFTAGPSGLSAEMLAVHALDQPRYVLSGPAMAIEAPEGDEVGKAVTEGSPESARQRITIGDVWDALDAAGLRPDAAGMGHAYFFLRGDRTLDMPNRSFLDWGTASDDLLAVLRTWDIQPVASGKYAVRPEVDPNYARGAWGSLRDIPRGRSDQD
jgi:hypothetical protein